MKKSKISALISIFVLIPLTLFLGSHLSGRAYYLTSTLVLFEIMLPFFLAFEGRKPAARELVVVAVLCAIAVAGRVVIPLPHFKLTFAIIMLSGIALGAQTGFLVGAVAALASNFFFGQGAHTPWQMLGYGMAGLIMGFAYRKKWFARKRLSMAIWGAAVVLVIVGPILDTCTVFLSLTEFTVAGVTAIYLSGLPVNATQAVATALTIFFFGEPLLEKLDRVKLNYGMMEDDDGI